MRENVSDPITNARLNERVRSMLSAVESPKTKPEHTACRSNAAPCVMPSAACTVTALAGKVWSGVDVASTIRSIDDASTLAAASAAFAASTAMSEVNSPVAASRRSWMPVR